MKLNQTHEEMIRNFAKMNKMSGPKLVDFAAQLFATVNIKEGKQVGRKVSPEMLAIRNSVKDYLLSVGNNKFTTIDITKAVGCSVAEANNTLTFYKNEFNISVIGKQEKEGKGKRPNLYQVCNNWVWRLISQSGFDKMFINQDHLMKLNKGKLKVCTNRK